MDDDLFGITTLTPETFIQKSKVLKRLLFVDLLSRIFVQTCASLINCISGSKNCAFTQPRCLGDTKKLKTYDHNSKKYFRIDLKPYAYIIETRCQFYWNIIKPFLELFLKQFFIWETTFGYNIFVVCYDAHKILHNCSYPNCLIRTRFWPGTGTTTEIM